MALNDLGAVPASSVLPIFWTSHDGTTGANEAMSALAVGDILIYKGTSMTQRSSTAGFTLLDTDGIDVDTLTGVNAISIDLGDNTDASFYAAGSFYNVILGPVTIDAQTMYIHLATFRIVAAEGIAGTPKSDVAAWLGTAAATPTVAGVPEVDITHIGGTAVTAAAGIPEVKVASIAANAITAASMNADAGAEIADAVWDEAISGHQTVGTTGRNLTLAGVIIAETTAAGTPTTTTVELTAGSAVNDFYTDMEIIPVSGSLAGQARVITGYVGATKVITVDEAFTSAIAAGDALLIRARHTHSKTQLADAIHDEVVEGSLTFRVLTRLMAAALMGEISGAEGTTVVIRDASDTKTRITATVTSDGNRTTLTLDGS